MKTIDLRSDTVTLPTEEMLQSIPKAALGDDVEMEDPTVNELQEYAAAKFGAEAALLVPSGTQGNLIAMLVHCRRGDEIVLEADAHMYYYEIGGMSALAGCMPRLIKGERGVFTAGQVFQAVRHYDALHFPPSRLLEIENTHNRAGGTCWSVRQVEEVSKAARELGMKVHMDGARIFNASVALGVDVRDYMEHVDSLDFCLSKGLCAPVGSLMLGSKEFIEKARVCRKMVGGGMRQAGIIAAPGLMAMKRMIPRLKEDHDNARRLALGLDGVGGMLVDMKRVQTNIVLVDVAGTGMSALEFVAEARKNGILIFDFATDCVRFVTHHGISAADVDEAVERLSRMLR
jgi:threonine aldolase